MVVVAHPSEGMADSCATSRHPDSLRDLALPWAAQGYPVIAPDYAGLGTAGVAAAVVTAAGKPATAVKAEAPADTATRYQASAHVLKYYQTTKV